MLIKEILHNVLNEQLILEDRLDFLKTKFVASPSNKTYNRFVSGGENTLEVPQGKITDNEFEVLKKTDPTKNKKYLQWLISSFLKLNKDEKARFLHEDNEKTTEDLSIFERYNKRLPQDKRDINKIKDFATLWSTITPIKQDVSDEEEESAGANNVTKVYEDATYLIIIPRTKESSCKYGMGTRWCTASSDRNFYEQYSEEGPLFIIIHKNEKDKEGRQEKYQFHFQSEQFMDIEDNQIDFKKYIEDNQIVAEALAKYIVGSDEFPDKFEALMKLEKSDLISQEIIDQKVKAIKEGDNKGSLTVDVAYKLFKNKRITLEDLNSIKRDDSIFFTEDKVYAVYFDWCSDDLAALFADNGRNDYEAAAKQILCGEAYSWFDDMESNNLIDIDLNEKAMSEIRKTCSTRIPTEKLTELSDSDLIELINDDDSFEDIKSAIRSGDRDARRNAMEHAYWEGYTNLIIKKLGSFEFINDDKLSFVVDFDKWLKRIYETYEYQNTDFTEYSNFTSWIRHVLKDEGDEIAPRDEYYGSASAVDIAESVSERLGEI